MSLEAAAPLFALLLAAILALPVTVASLHQRRRGHWPVRDGEDEQWQRISVH